MSGHTFSPTHVARIALAGAVIGLGALAAAGQANAEPVVPPLPTPVPGETPAPGQPVMEVPGTSQSLRLHRHRSGHRPCRRSRTPSTGREAGRGRWASSGMLGIRPRTRTDSPVRRLARCPQRPHPRREPVRRRSCRPDTNRSPTRRPTGLRRRRGTTRAGRLCRRGTTRSTGHRRPGTSTRLPPRGIALLPAAPPPAGPIHRRRSQACYASAGMTSRSNSSIPERS